MAQTAANLVEHVLPEGAPLRQFVVTFPFQLRYRLAYDGKLLGHLVHYAGVLGAASKWRALVVPPLPEQPATGGVPKHPPTHRSRYRPWPELLKRTFAIDVEKCPSCGGRLKLRALVTRPASVERYLRYLGEPTAPPPRAPARDPPYAEEPCRPAQTRRGGRASRTGGAVRSVGTELSRGAGLSCLLDQPSPAVLVRRRCAVRVHEGVPSWLLTLADAGRSLGMLPLHPSTIPVTAAGLLPGVRRALCEPACFTYAPTKRSEQPAKAGP